MQWKDVQKKLNNVGHMIYAHCTSCVYDWAVDAPYVWLVEETQQNQASRSTESVHSYAVCSYA